jgi:hypothetical protein
MNPLVFQTVGSLIVAGGGAWVGSRVGVGHALQKLRNERAFERRLAWYEETVLATVAVRDMSVAYATATRFDRSKLAALAPAMSPVLQTFADRANKAVLYAPKHIVQRLDLLMKELGQFALETVKTLEQGQLYEEFAKNVDSLALSFSRFIFELAQELRQELGLDKIVLSDVQKNALDPS